jgi:hypothetical protein
MCLSMPVFLLLRSIASQVDYKVLSFSVKMSSTLSLFDGKDDTCSETLWHVGPFAMQRPRNKKR